MNLPENIFEKPVMRATRDGFGEELLEAGKNNESIVALCADLTESTKMDAFAKAFSNRFVEIGVAEQNLVTVASGMAAMGKVPFCSSYAMFSPGRNWEQIRTTICYNDRKVIIVGSHTGVSVGPDGGTHQALEDIAIMRVLPNMAVVVPCDAIEAKKATLALASESQKSPAYLRLTKQNTPVMTTDETPFEIGKSYAMYQSGNELLSHKKIGIISCGPIIYEALKAAKELEMKDFHVTVVNMHTIKPLDTESIRALAKNVEMIITVEEHQSAGGLGSAIAEFLAQHHPLPMKIIGVNDRYGQSGTPEELLVEYGLTANDIVAACL